MYKAVRSSNPSSLRGFTGVRGEGCDHASNGWIDTFSLQPIQDPSVQALVLKLEPAFALLGISDQYILEAAKGSFSADSNLQESLQALIRNCFDKGFHIF